MVRVLVHFFVSAVTILTITATAFAEETTVFSGGTILTVDDDFRVADAMAVRGNRILSVGTEESVRTAAGPDATTVDLSGKVVMPAFIDAHSHPVVGGATQVFENVGIDRFDDIQDVLDHMSKVSSTGDHEWLLFKNLDLTTQSFTKPQLTNKELDKISSKTPVVVWHAGGHKMTVNSKMLGLMGVSSDFQNLSGAELGRHDDGSLDGNVAGSVALFAALKEIKPFNEFDRFKGAVELGQNWAAQGIGTLGVAGVTGPEDWQVLIKLADSKEFPLRTRNYLQWAALPLWDEADVKPGTGDMNARAIGYKISVDGSNQAYTGLQREPYLNREDRGLAYMTQSEIDDAVAEGSRRGAQMAMHGNGDAGIDNIISAVAKARGDGLDLLRPRIEHCSIVQDDQIDKLKENEITCSFLIAHVLYWGEAFRDTVFGPEKAAKLDRTGSFERAKIPYSLHTDYAVSTLSPLEMIEVAVTRTLFTQPDFVLSPDERASIEHAVRGVTSVPAWQLMSEDEVGSLEEGKLADFVVLSADPRTVDPDQISEIQILETWIEGRRAH